MSQFRNILDFLVNLGFYDVILPFLLVFTIVFALLERTKVFGMEEIDGKKWPKKNLNTIAAVVIAFFVVLSSQLVAVITSIASKFVILLFLIVLFLLLVGSFFQEKPEAVYLTGGWKTLFMVIVFVALLFIFLDALGWLDDTFGFVSGHNQGEIVGTAILFILLVLFIVWITQDRGKNSKSDDHNH